MSGQTPWSIKGIRAETREAAKGLAQRDGLTIGEWMNRLIEDIGTTEDDGGGQSPHHGSAQPGWGRPHQQPAPQHVASGLPPFPGPAPSAAAGGAGDASRLAAALETLTRRLETMPVGPQAGTVSTAPASRPANQSMFDRAMMAVGERLEDSERRTDRTFGQIDATLSEIRQTHAAIADRLRRLEEADPAHKSLGALRALEGTLGQIAARVQEQDGRSEALARDVAALRSQIATPAASAVTPADLESVSLRTGEGLKALGETVEAVAGRLGEMEALTTGAIEEADRGLHLLSDRVASTEALAGETSARLADLMVDLSARITEVETIAQSVTTAPPFLALQRRLADMEARLGEMADGPAALAGQVASIDARMGELGSLEARFADLDNRVTRALEATRVELAEALKDGIDSRVADVASSLAERLDAVERRSAAAMEKVGGEIAKVASALSQRLQRLEETDAGARDAQTSQRLELARITRAIDDRLASLENRDTTLVERAGAQMQQVVDQLSQRLDQSERRTLDSVSEQMRTLADRLQARQEEASTALGRRIDEADERANRRVEERISFLTREIQAAEDRAKAVAAPLHRNLDTMIDRLERIETRAIEPYAETVGFSPAGGPGFASRESAGPAYKSGDYELAEPVGVQGGIGMGAFAPGSYTAPGDMFLDGGDDPFNARSEADEFGARHPADASATRSGFASPFPVNEVGSSTAFPGAQPSGSMAAGGLIDGDVGGPVAFDDDMMLVGLDEPLVPAGRPDAGAGPGDYLSRARQAAIGAAIAREQDVPGRRGARPAKAAKPGKPEKAPRAVKASRPVSADGKSKSPVSPVVVVAAAGLVVAGGLYAFNALRGTPEADQPPAVLVTPPATPPGTDAAGQAPAPAPAPQPDVGGAVAPTEPASADPATTQAMPPATPAATDAAADAVAAAPARPEGSSALRALQREQEARARAAQARADAVAARTATPRLPAPKRDETAARPATRPATGPATAASAGTAARTASTAAARTSATPPASAAPPARATATARPAAADARAAFDEATRRQQAGDAAGALALMRQAAESGDTRAQNRLARMYERGEGGVERDMAAARRWTERAAAAGSRQAQHNLGVYYADGEGTQRDFGRAAENFTRAARRGSADSQYNLGAMSEQGLGRPRSDSDAYYWYSLAARSGDRDAAAKAEQAAARLDPAARQAADERVRAFQPEAGDVD